MHGKFYKHFARQWQEGDWEGWTPPWMQREWRGPRGPWGHGPGPWGQGQGPWGHEHGHGPGPGHEHGPGRRWGVSPEMQALWSEAGEVARLFAIASRSAFDNRDRLNQLRSMLERSHKELADMIFESGQSESQGQGSSAPNTEQA
jgi:hypothetical protein